MAPKPQNAQPTEVLTTTTPTRSGSKRKKSQVLPGKTQTVSQPVVSKPGQVAIAVSHELHTCQGGRAKNLYYRYRVWRGHRVLHSVHIPGGNVDKPLAIARSNQVKGWIKGNVDPHKILRKLEQWKRDDKNSRAQQLTLL